MATAVPVLDAPARARSRDPRELLNAVQPHIDHLTVNILGCGTTLWEREVALLLRDHTMVRDMAERILGNAVMYTVGCIEHPEVHLGVGNGRYKHHAPFIERRSDGLCLRTADFLATIGFDIDEELWAIDGTECSPCDSKVPDSH